MQKLNSHFILGYEVADFAHIVKHLDKLLRQTPAEGIVSFKMKYLHADYYKVAEITLKDINSLLEEYPETLAWSYVAAKCWTNAENYAL